MIKNNLSSIYQIPEYKYIISEFANNKNSKDVKLLLDGIKIVDAMCYSQIPISNNKQGYIFKKIVRKLLFTLKKLKIPLYLFINKCSSILAKYTEILQIMQKESVIFDICLNKFKRHTKEINEITEEKAIYLHETHGIHYNITYFLSKELNIKVLFDIETIGKKIKGENTLNKHNNFEDKYEKTFYSTVLLYNKDTIKLCKNDFIILNETNNIISNFKKIQNGKLYYILPKLCNVYPNMGGQKCDNFIIKDQDNNTIFKGLEAFRINNYIFLKVESIACLKSDSINIEIDMNNRTKVSQNHSLTHIISHFISVILGEKIVQISSSIDRDKCKFSFFSQRQIQITISKLEEIINLCIKNEKLRISINHLPFEYAKKTFKTISYKNYPSYVRTVTIYSDGYTIQSKEVCAGTHNVEFDKIKIVNLIRSKNKHITNIEFTVL